MLRTMPLHFCKNFWVQLTCVWFFIPACSSPIPHYIGDGWCDDENNNNGCGFDGGDCCGPDVKTQYCSECECLGENITSTASPGPFCSCSMEDTIGCELLIYFHKIIWKRAYSNLIFKAVKHLTLSVMAIVGIIQILQNAIMMEVIVVDLMLTHYIVLNVYATHMIPVMVHLTWSQMDTAMMKPTMQVATLMVVTVVVPVPTLTNVQIVCVMKEVHQQLIHHVSTLVMNRPTPWFNHTALLKKSHQTFLLISSSNLGLAVISWKNNHKWIDKYSWVFFMTILVLC